MSARAGGRHLGSGGLGLVDLLAELDTSEAGLWPGGRFVLHVQGTAGRDPSTFVGDLQVTDNVEADDAIRVYEGFYEHGGRDGRWRARAGWQDYNSEFNLLPLAGVLLNSSFGIHPEILQGQVPTYPLTSPALTVHLEPASALFLKAGIYESVPANAIHPLSRLETAGAGDGHVAALEVGTARPGPGPGSFKLAVGGWHLDREFRDPVGNERGSNRGGYLIAERQFPLGRDGRAWGLFAQAGTSRADRNQLKGYLGAGVVLHGPWKGRPDDTLSVGVARARLSGPFLAASPGRRQVETAWELTYRLALRPGLALQPDLQYVHHPDAEPSARDALVGALRLVASF